MSATASFPSKLVSPEGDIAEISDKQLDITGVIAAMKNESAGALALFIGTTRNSFEDKEVVRLEYEAHTTLALRTIQKIMVAKRDEDQSLLRMMVHHRIGNVPVGEASIIIAVSAPHRRPAFSTCESILEEVKRKVQIWKREWYAGEEEEDALWKENFT